MRIPKRLLLLIFSLMLAMSLALVGCGQETAEPAAQPVAEVDHQDDDHHDDDDDHHHDDDDDHHHDDDDGHHHDDDDDHHHDDDDDHHHDDDDDHHHDDDDHGHDDDDHGHDHDAEMLVLPALTPVQLAGGEKLRVVATTSIIGDIVGRIGGDAIELTVLMGPDVDPHSYQASAAELTAVADAHVIFINGWDLEEGLIRDLENIGEGIPMVPVSAYIDLLEFDDDHGHSQGDSHDHDHGHDADPHTWFNPHLVEQWVDNIEHALHDLDPANEELYETNAEDYLAELEELIEYFEARLAEIPAERRKLVTNHDTFGHFARAYDFSIVGTIIPSVSTVAEPSARDLAQLVDAMEAEGVCTIFTETVANERLAQAVAAELSGCAEVQILRLFTDALGGPGSGAETYLDMMRVNIDTIVAGLTS